jgi:hypothetical protein
VNARRLAGLSTDGADPAVAANTTPTS